MNAMPSTATMTVRLPEQVQIQLEQLAQTTRRTKTSLVLEALEYHLAKTRAPSKHQSPYEALMRYKGAAAISGGRSKAEIEAIMHDIRGDD